MPPLIDLTGQRFGRLVVVGRDGSDKTGHGTGCGNADVTAGRWSRLTPAVLEAGTLKAAGV